MILKKGATSQGVTLRIIDASDGTPETGVVFNTSGIDLWYRRENAFSVDITEANLSTPDLEDVWETGGFLHINDGYYRLDVPDAAFASAAGVDHVIIGGTVTGMIVIGVVVQLTDFDPQDAVRAGLTSLPASGTMIAAGPTKAEMDTAHGLLATPSQVKTQADAALSDIHLDHLVIAQGTVETDGANSSTQVKTTLAEATNDHYNDGTILFLNNAEAGQWRTINDYIGATGIVKWEDALTGTPGDGTEFVLLPVGTSAHNVWETILTGAEHNTPTSAGRRLRELGEVAILASGQIVTVTDGRTIELDTGAVATADFYIGQRLEIEEGTGAGQTRIIVAYSALRVCLLDSPFTTNPDTNSLYAVVAADVHTSVSDSDMAEGLVATYTNTTTITLDSGALANADYYNDMLIVFTHGTGAGQAREIKAYTSGRVVTLSPALDTALSTDTVYHIQAVIFADEIAGDVWDSATADHVVAGSFGLATPFSTQISDSVPAVGTLLTREQALYMLSQRQLDFAIVGTTLTVFKVDGTTALYTLTLDDAANPTAAARAT